jgi:hypothetical protein
MSGGISSIFTERVSVAGMESRVGVSVKTGVAESDIGVGDITGTSGESRIV